MRATIPRLAACTALAACAVAACGSNEPRPAEELTRARVLIDQADKSGARQFSSMELQSARDKLRRAEALAAEDTQQARRLAVQASLDAELAAARARSGKAESAAEELAASVATLREESARSGGALPPASRAPQPEPRPPLNETTQPRAGETPQPQGEPR